ncbi:MAG: sialidase family protein [Acidimicrobiales bacterium]|nr:sialidase family protein [Acidimicrobiales bacterium]
MVSLEDGSVFVGGHEAVAVTRDEGRTWSPVPSLDDADAMGWGLTDDALFVAGHPGLRRSTDAGATFRPVDGLPDPDAHALGAGADVLYAAGPALGVVASRDNGLTWEQRSSSNGASFFGRIVVDRTNPDRLFAADAQAGPATSSDGGRNWQSLRRPAAVWVSSPDGGTTIYASSGGGQAWRSADGGKNWATLRLPEGAQLVEAAALGDGRKLYAAGRDGDTARLWVSVDAGASWEAPAASRSKS